MKIIDNFLDKNNFKLVKDTFQASNFPWYYTPFQVKPGDNSFMFCHLFVNDDKRHSQFTESMRPFLNKLNIKKLLRIKANLTTKKQEHIKGEMHTDFENCTTAIWYLNTNNGYTLFEDGIRWNVLKIEWLYLILIKNIAVWSQVIVNSES